MVIANQLFSHAFLTSLLKPANKTIMVDLKGAKSPEESA
jgi:hypothetical protein